MESQVIHNSTELTTSEFMWACMALDGDYRKCPDCGGTGAKAIMCCNGHECGCMALPVDFDKCDCGIPFPTDDQLREVIKKTATHHCAICGPVNGTCDGMDGSLMQNCPAELIDIER